MLNKKNSGITIAVIIILSIVLLSPLLVTFLNSIFADYTSFIPREFTLKYYASLFTGDKSMIPALGGSLFISIIPVILSLVFLLAAMFVIEVYFPQFDKYLDLLSKIPYGIQGVILAVSIISLYGAMRGFLGNRVILLIGAYCIVILPYMYQGIKNAMSTIQMLPILEAAELLGCSRIRTFFTIIVPSINNGLIATIILTVGIIFGDFVLVNIIAGSYFETLGIYLNLIRSTSGHTASAVSVIIIITMLVLSIISNKLREKSVNINK